jgi:hypothetical protein
MEDVNENWKIEKDKFSHLQLLQKWGENIPDDFKKYLLVDSENFNNLLCLVKPHTSVT